MTSVSTRMTAWVVAATMFLSQLDGTVIHTALPAMAADFGMAPVDLSIGITAYLLALAVFLPASAWVADRFGARKVFAIAVLGFTVTSLFCGLSQNLEQFITARILQGAAGALMTPVGRVVLIRATPKDELVHVLALTSAPMLLGPTFGPAIGGFCVTYLSWHWAFFVNIPIGFVSCWAILRYVPLVPPEKPRAFDVTGFILAAIAMSGLILGFDRISSPSGEWRLPALILLAGLLASVLLVRHSLRAASPLISLSPLSSEIFRITALTAGSLVRLGIRALPFLLPLMFQLTMGMSAFTAGLMLIALNGADLVIKPLVGRVLQNFGFRSSLVCSCFASALGTAACSLFFPQTPFWVILTCLGLIGLARSILFTGISTLLYADVEDCHVTSATVLWNVLQQVSNAFAISLSALMLNGLAALDRGWGAEPDLFDFRVTLLFYGVLTLLGALSFLRLPRNAGASLSGHRS